MCVFGRVLAHFFATGKKAQCISFERNSLVFLEFGLSQFPSFYQKETAAEFVKRFEYSFTCLKYRQHGTVVAESVCTSFVQEEAKEKRALCSVQTAQNYLCTLSPHCDAR